MFILCFLLRLSLAIERKKNPGRSMEKHHLTVFGCETGRGPQWVGVTVSWGKTAVCLRLKSGLAQLEHPAAAHSFPRLWAQWCRCISALLHVPRKRGLSL